MSTLILEKLPVDVISARGDWVIVNGESYWPCPTKDMGTWLAPRHVIDLMVGPRPPDGWTSGDMCTIVPERIGEFDTWVACYFHDYHYSMVAAGDLSRWMADFWFARNSYREVYLRGGGTLRARLAQSRAWGTNLFGWMIHKPLLAVAFTAVVAMAVGMCQMAIGTKLVR